MCIRDRSNTVTFPDGRKASCGLVCELMHLEGAECLAEYGSNFYANTPAITRNPFGRGCTYYIGTCMSDAGIAEILEKAISDASIVPVIDEPTELESTCRKADDCSYYFVMNFKDKELTIPSVFAGRKDILTDRIVTAEDRLAKFVVKIIQMK